MASLSQRNIHVRNWCLTDSALVAQRYEITKSIKEESAAYLKAWLDCLKESPEYIKTTLFDVKRASAMVTGEIDRVNEKLENGIGMDDADERRGYEPALRVEETVGGGWRRSFYDKNEQINSKIQSKTVFSCYLFCGNQNTL